MAVTGGSLEKGHRNRGNEASDKSQEMSRRGFLGYLGAAIAGGGLGAVLSQPGLRKFLRFDAPDEGSIQSNSQIPQGGKIETPSPTNTATPVNTAMSQPTRTETPKPTATATSTATATETVAVKSKESLGNIVPFNYEIVGDDFVTAGVALNPNVPDAREKIDREWAAVVSRVTKRGVDEILADIKAGKPIKAEITAHQWTESGFKGPKIKQAVDLSKGIVIRTVERVGIKGDVYIQEGGDAMVGVDADGRVHIDGIIDKVLVDSYSRRATRDPAGAGVNFSANAGFMSSLVATPGALDGTERIFDDAFNLEMARSLYYEVTGAAKVGDLTIDGHNYRGVFVAVPKVK